MTSTLRPSRLRTGRRAPSGRARVGRWVWRAVLVLVAMVGLYLVVTFLQVWHASRSDAAPASDAIVVLGAAQYDCEPSPVLGQRLDHALGLYRDGVAGTIVVTGGKLEGDRCTEASASADYLRAEGVPDEDLLLEVQGRNSWESLAATGRILRERGLTRVVLVTDGYHAYRVEAIAEDSGLDATVSPTDTRLSGTSELRQLSRETVAVAIGRIIGYDRLLRLDNAVND